MVVRFGRMLGGLGIVAAAIISILGMLLDSGTTIHLLALLACIGFAIFLLAGFGRQFFIGTGPMVPGNPAESLVNTLSSTVIMTVAAGLVICSIGELVHHPLLSAPQLAVFGCTVSLVGAFFGLVRLLH